MSAGEVRSIDGFGDATSPHLRLSALALAILAMFCFVTGRLQQ